MATVDGYFCFSYVMHHRDYKKLTVICKDTEVKRADGDREKDVSAVSWHHPVGPKGRFLSTLRKT